MDEELRDNWDLERDREEPRENVLPVKNKENEFTSKQQNVT